MPKKSKKRKKRKKRELKWLSYYCKVSGFEAWGDKDGPTLELDLELLEPVPKVTSLTLTVYDERSEYKFEDRAIQGRGTERRLVTAQTRLRGYASRRPDGSVNVATWWDPQGVSAMLAMLVGGFRVYVSLNAKEFYYNQAEVAGIEWFTQGAWRADVVGEDSDLY